MEAVTKLERHFEEELTSLQGQLLRMGGLVVDRVRQAMTALVGRDPVAARQVIEGDGPVNDLHIEIDTRVFTLLALHQPVARDLRAAVGAIKISTDLERVGDLAVNMAEVAERCLRRPPVKPLIDIPRMADIALNMLVDALDAFVRRDIGLAENVLTRDDELDALKDQVFRELLTHMLQQPSTIEPALDLVLVSRQLERVGDHATNVAENVIFIVAAHDVRHHATDLRG